MIKTGDIIAIIDDIMVGTEMGKECDDIVEEILKKNGKEWFICETREICIKDKRLGALEVVIGLDRAKIEKEKIQGVVNWPVPRGVKDVQKFLGLVNYYRQFVKEFAKIAKLLYEMTRKDMKWNWGEKQQRVSEKLKERFTTEQVLIIPNLVSDKKYAHKKNNPQKNYERHWMKYENIIYDIQIWIVDDYGFRDTLHLCMLWWSYFRREY